MRALHAQEEFDLARCFQTGLLSQTLKEQTWRNKQFKASKASDNDSTTSKVIYNNLEWWTTPRLASHFLLIYCIALIPREWGLYFTVPINIFFLKKGNQDLLANNHPISLLNLISKLYAKHLS